MLGIHGTLIEQNGGFRGAIAKIMAATEESPIEAAEACAETWRGNVRKDTRSYELGIYTQTHTHSEYGAAVTRAKAANPSVGIRSELPRPQRKGAANVGSVVTHDIFNELGTTTLPADSAFAQALATTRKQFPEITKRKLVR